MKPSDRQIKNFVGAILSDVLEEMRSDRFLGVDTAFHKAFNIDRIALKINTDGDFVGTEEEGKALEDANAEIEMIINAYENLFKDMMKNPNKYFDFKF
jgi:hypothetical protein